MSYSINYYFVVPMLLCLCLIVSCKNVDENDLKRTEEEILLDQLSKTWIPGTIKRDETNITNEFSGFALTFTHNKTYCAENGRSVFPSSGTWEFIAGNTNRILRDDEVVMDIEVTETNLYLLFRISSPTGRSAGLTGEYEFDLTTQ